MKPGEGKRSSALPWESWNRLIGMARDGRWADIWGEWGMLCRQYTEAAMKRLHREMVRATETPGGGPKTALPKHGEVS